MILSQAILFTTSLSIAITYHVELRTNFQNRRKPNKISLLEGQKTKKYMNGIEHSRKQDLSNKDAKMVEDLESDFRRLVAMRGVKYLYKRDMHWRTWRSVKVKHGVEKKVYYKCNNQLVKNSTGCTDCGLWIKMISYLLTFMLRKTLFLIWAGYATIEDPPCPLEYYSVVDKDWMCVYNLSMKRDPDNVCPAKIKFLDLPITCDNPMKTNWLFTSEFGADYKNIICGEKTYCELFTTYSISPMYVSFRMINSTGNIIYSRIMTHNNTNYVCINECGIYDPHVKKVTILDNPTAIILGDHKNTSDVKMNDKGMKLESVVDSNLKNNNLSKTNAQNKYIHQYVHRTRRETEVRRDLPYPLFNISMTTTVSNNVIRTKMVHEQYDNDYPDYLIL